MVHYLTQDSYAQNLAGLPLFEHAHTILLEQKLQRRHHSLIARYNLSPHMAAVVASNLGLGGAYE